MKTSMVRIISLLVAIMMLVACTCSCASDKTADSSSLAQSKSSSKASGLSSKATGSKEVSTEAYLNGVDISKYTIVYGEDSLDYVYRAAKYICDEIEERVGVELDMVKDSAQQAEHEILVGETTRDTSKALNANLSGTNFALLAKDGNVAMEANYFVIAAAAYYFVETYIPEKAEFSTAVPTKTTECTPITKKAKNYIVLIGDGMGVPQTKLFENKGLLESSPIKIDGENFFYGYMLPYSGFSRTDSLTGTTDSAAGGTALSTGYKTINSYVGLDKNKEKLTSLTEIAGSLGMATAVMSTEASTGATPASFSAHAEDRNMSTEILESQKELVNKYGTVINCDLLGSGSIPLIEQEVTNTIKKLAKNEKGFFMMYEEAHIDKNCHNKKIEETFQCVLRFNQIIGVVMEYAFYNPETFVLITADHETGGMKKDEETGDYVYTKGDHSSQDVPIFAYGAGAQVFNGKTIENIQIPRTISLMMGKEIVASDSNEFPALK